MSLAPLFNADPAIQLHALSASAAVIIGGLVLWRPKGTRLHKTMGRVWVGLMLVAATSALFINEIRMIGPFSPIHVFSLVTYVSISQGLYAIIVKRDVARHRAEMQGLYIWALLLAGAFTLLPGRRMHQVLFGPEAGWTQSLIAMGLILGLAAIVSLRLRRSASREISGLRARS